MPKQRVTLMVPPTEHDVQHRPDEVIRGPKGHMWRCAYCKRPASSESLKGKRLCKAHGGVTAAQRDPEKRAAIRARGETPKHPPGRPAQHGRSSRSARLSIDELVTAYRARQMDADATDEDMLHLRAHLEVLKRTPVPIGTLEAALQGLPAQLEALTCELKASENNLTVQTLVEMGTKVNAIGHALGPALRSLTAVDRQVRAVEMRHARLVRLSKVRAETNLKDHDAKQLLAFTSMCRGLLVGLEAQLSPELYAALRQRIARDLSEVHQRLLDAGPGSVASR